MWWWSIGALETTFLKILGGCCANVGEIGHSYNKYYKSATSLEMRYTADAFQ